MKNRIKKVMLCLVTISFMSGCNAFRGLGQDISGMYNGMRESYDANTVRQDGATMTRMRDLGWNDDHLLDHPSYGVK